ncbi:hypothetical protein D9M69_446960 [compost metagenome]
MTEQPDTVEELNAALQQECQRYNDLYLKYSRLAASVHQLTTDMAVMCEAYLAGDNSMVVAKVRGFAEAYQRNTKPTDGRVH